MEDFQYALYALFPFHQIGNRYCCQQPHLDAYYHLHQYIDQSHQRLNVCCDETCERMFKVDDEHLPYLEELGDQCYPEGVTLLKIENGSHCETFHGIPHDGCFHHFKQVGLKPWHILEIMRTNKIPYNALVCGSPVCSYKDGVFNVKIMKCL